MRFHVSDLYNQPFAGLFCCVRIISIMERIDIPYVASLDDYSCALACHAMVANYFVPGTAIEDVARMVDWQKGYAVWAFRFWKWLIEHGVHITDYDLIDYEAWARDGVNGLRRSLPTKEFEWYQSATRDLDALSSDVAAVINNPALTYHMRKPVWNDLIKAHERGALCEAVLDSPTLDDVEGFELHRVVILDVTDSTVTFHDPRLESESIPSRRVPAELFKAAWLDAFSAPELCIYEKVTSTHTPQNRPQTDVRKSL